MPIKPTLPLLLACLALFSGCATGSYSVKVPIAGGTTVPIGLGSTGPVHAENNDVKIENAILQIDGKSKLATYIFEFKVKGKAAPRSVKIEDVSDEEPVTLMEASPVPLSNGRWKSHGTPMTPDQRNVKWLYEIDNSIRVYRFTIVTAGGRKEELFEGTSYPAHIKEYIRKQLGTEPAPVGRR